jgi:hypothetical protein
MPLVEILDGPPEWAGTAHETDEDMVADEIGLTHPRWGGTPLASYRALYAYRKVEVAGDRHRYPYQGPFDARPIRRHDGVEDLTGWDVLVVQPELHSDDPRKLWGSPVRVYAAPPGTPRPDPARSPEEQGWRELDQGGWLRRPRAPGTGAFFQERLARQLAEGNPWVVEHWRRLAERQGAAKDAEVERIEREQSWMALQDRVLLVVHPDLELDDDNGPLYGFAKLYSAPPATPPPDPAVAPERQGWAELAEGDFLLPWLLHIARYEL